MEKIKQITSGKAKSLYTTNDGNFLVMEFRDDTSAFDGKKTAALENKGKVNNQFNAFIMEYLATQNIDTHFVKLLSNTESLVKNLEMFPIECVVRNRATGSLCKRLGIEDGLILETPLFEFFLKDDDLGDPLINDNHIISFGWANREDLSVMQSMTLKVNELLVAETVAKEELPKVATLEEDLSEIEGAKSLNSVFNSETLSTQARIGFEIVDCAVRHSFLRFDTNFEKLSAFL